MITELTLDQLTFQLAQLEAALEIRIGDLPAAQIIRAATRRLELQRQAIADLYGLLGPVPDGKYHLVTNAAALM